MRKKEKAQCLETIDVLEEAHAEIVNLIKKKQLNEASELLGQCQQGAIGIGNLIEESEGEGTEEVHELEHYCELVYQISAEILDGAEVNTARIAKNLKRPLIRVANGIRNRIRTHREVVFLPYKASMWDSLESVWKELSKDPNVTTLVIPIPYYEKNPDGSFKELHYEGDQFHDDVPVVHYKDYNIEERHPDAIYFHNPYDELNIVTSVHPNYFSSKLKDCTEELVYIPYYVLDEIDPDNKAQVEGNRHFVLVPGVLNAHRVLVQSENWRTVYVNVLTEYAGKDTRRYWEKKIEVRVSPKIERVRNLKESDFELPEEWKRLVEQSDGTKKKIIFYNTSVGALLNENEKMIDKIQRVLETFKENSDKVTLLWRPHPLMESTLTSMRPFLWQKYKAMVDAYRSEGWGIYDDSADLDRAIAISDAYFGDWSSVVWLYKETGKPIMIQNVGV